MRRINSTKKEEIIYDITIQLTYEEMDRLFDEWNYLKSFPTIDDTIELILSARGPLGVNNGR